LLTLKKSLPQRLPKNMAHFRPTWAEISRGAFSSNLKSIASSVNSGTRVLAVLKADGYGHGALPLAEAAVQGGVFGIGVSSLEEGIHLREGGIKAPILILAGIFPLENFEIAREFKLTPTVASLEAAQALQKVAQQSNTRLSFHLKVDTGMGRIGVSPAGAKAVLDWTLQEPSLSLEGVYTHFATADSDLEFMNEQLKLFRDVIHEVEIRKFPNVVVHSANTAAIFSNNESHFNLVRPGLGLFGYSTVVLPNALSLFPVLSWHTKVIFLKKVPANTSISYSGTFRTSKESEIATLPVGYADGVPLRVSNIGSVLINGRRCPIVGRVTMDHIMVNVTGLECNVGDEVILIGSQDQEKLTAQDWAGWAGTNAYEILCGISKRVPRIYGK
jgi:alanine racemase